ncbi:MAG: hypothetical protein NUV91_09985 [Candidatus Omnitrophica bacterium]|nr:hypothetical protein [Candidatus Omnitrophota bacterium]
MSSILFAMIGIFLIILLLAVLLFTPHERKEDSKKVPESSDETKDWKATSLKLEKHIQALRQKNIDSEKHGKDLERELVIQQEKYQQLQEKLKVQKSWQEKEDAEFEKHKKEIFHLREVINQTESKLNEEHGERLRLDRRNRDVEQESATMKDVIRSLESEVAKLKAQADGYRQQIQELRSENAKLSKQHDDKVWVAKSEYQKLEGLYQESEKEINKLKEKIRREIG